MKKVTFTSVAKKVNGPDGARVGAWTDGIGVFCDGFALTVGKTYKVTIEEVDATEAEKGE